MVASGNRVPIIQGIRGNITIKRSGVGSLLTLPRIIAFSGVYRGRGHTEDCVSHRTCGGPVGVHLVTAVHPLLQGPGSRSNGVVLPAVDNPWIIVDGDFCDVQCPLNCRVERNQLGAGWVVCDLA